MVEIRVEPVPLQPRVVVDHRPVTAQFLYENLVAQPLRGVHIVFGLGEFYTELGGGGSHRPRLCALPWF